MQRTADVIPPGYQVIDVRVGELRQLFDAIDPSPLHNRDIDPRTEDFIAETAMGLPSSAGIALRVHVDSAAEIPDAARIVSDAVHAHFRRKADSARSRLKELFRRGRISLVIGLAALGVASLAANAVQNAPGFPGILRESLIIGGWVAMWRPLEVFLYDWWPILADARRYDRLAVMPVQVEAGSRS